MTEEQIKYYKEKGIWGTLIVTANVTFLTTYVMELEYPYMIEELGKKYRHSIKYNLDRAYHLLEKMNDESVNYFKTTSTAAKVGEITLELSNELEDRICFDNKYTYIVLACARYMSSIQNRHDKTVESIYLNVLDTIHRLFEHALNKQVDESLMNVAFNVVKSVFDSITYEIDDDGNYNLVRNGVNFSK
jgi:hypothetical protein